MQDRKFLYCAVLFGIITTSKILHITQFKSVIICARMFYMASLPEKDAEEDYENFRLTISSNGQEYPSQSVFSSQRTEARGEPWCPCR